jgi:hypothetical protein
MNDLHEVLAYEDDVNLMGDGTSGYQVVVLTEKITFK